MRPRLFLIRALQALEAGPIWAVLGVMKLLPRRLAARAGAFLARGIGPLLPMSRVARRNLALCFPEKSPAERKALLRAMWDNLGRIAGEFTHRRALWDSNLAEVAAQFGIDNIRAGGLRGERVDLSARRVDVVGADQFLRLIEEKRPIAIFTAHMGNWEAMQWTAARMGLKYAVIY
ncbi:MAG: hypothetical protein ACREIP_13750, partial [Alphaproteobacteria bacterium]